MERLQRLVGALWLGSAFFLLLTSSAVFRVAPTPSAAGDVVGAMLTRWHYIALGAPLILFFIELRRLRPLILTVLFSAILFAATQAFVDLRIRQIRLSSPVPIASLQERSPLRRQFGVLHGTSMALLLLQGIAAGVFVLQQGRRPERPAGDWTERSWGAAPERVAEPGAPPSYPLPQDVNADHGEAATHRDEAAASVPENDVGIETPSSERLLDRPSERSAEASPDAVEKPPDER